MPLPQYSSPIQYPSGTLYPRPLQELEHLSSGMEHQDQENQQQQVQWRRDKVQELCSKGYSQREIFQILEVGLAIIYAIKMNRGVNK
jgi:hypothetical protein